jgi:hypothetical protein
MTVFKSKYQMWALIVGLPLLTLYIFPNFFYKKLWVLSAPLFLILAITFSAILVLGLVKRDRHIKTILIFSILAITVTEILKTEIFKSKIILKATLSDELSLIQLTLRKDHSFEMTSFTMFDDTTCRGAYTLHNDKIIFLDKPYDNNFIPDTVTILGDKIILRFDSNGKPITDFATFFSIKQSLLPNGP